MEHALRDDWDRHWTELSASTEEGPSPRYRTRLILKLLQMQRSPAPVRLLDIGSGLGDFAAEFHAHYPETQITGLEMSQTGIDIAARKVPSARFLQRNLLEPVVPADVPPGPATHAVCSEVLEHLDEPVVLLRNAACYLGAGCRLIVTVPGGPISEFYKHIGHRRHYTPRQLAEVLEQAGFTVERTYGAGFPFFNLFRLLLTLRGKSLIEDVSGSPSWHVRLGSVIFDALFRLDLMRWGWQTIAVARWPGP